MASCIKHINILFLRKFLFLLAFFASFFIYSKNPEPLIGGGGCCCGVNRELTFTNLDFESPPLAAFGGWIDYSAGQMYDGWTVTSGSVSIHHGSHGNMGAGNPNGSSQHLDLHGGTPGAFLYPLTGLTSGYTYTIELWYAIHIGVNSSNANLKIEGGAWLNTSWTAFNKGDALWLKASYMFVAKGKSTTMELVGSGPLQWGGMLIDDIRIFECPGDEEKPRPSTIPSNINLSCIKDLTPPEVITFTDNCDLTPAVNFTEKISGPECDRQIIRTWTATDKCGNTQELIQNIIIKDNEAPTFITIPKDTIIYCSSTVDSFFKVFLNTQGGATANDNCKLDHWENFYNRKPQKACDTIIINFIAVDACMNSSSSPSLFIVKDTIKPIIDSIINVDLPCGASARDSLRKWISNNAFAKAKDACGGLLKWKNDFNGDSLASEIEVQFTVEDECGNQSFKEAWFRQRSASDTVRLNSLVCNLNNEYYDTLTFVRPNCDSIVITHYTKARKDINQINIFTCNPLEAGIDTILLNNTEACDSIIITNKIFTPQKISTETKFSCTVTNTIVDSIYFIDQPCDSLHILTTIPARHDTFFMQKLTCDINQASKDTLLFVNSYGCDSTVITHTEYQAAIFTHLDSAQCNIAQSYNDTIVYKTLFCDSIVIINYSVLLPDTNRIYSQSCNPSNAGTFIKKYLNKSKCDSIVIEEIRFIPSDTSYSEAKICNSSIQEYDTTFQKNSLGCDSIHIHHNVYVKLDTSYIFNQVCDKTLAGTTYLKFQGILCDSIVVMTSTYKAEDSSFIELTTCHLNEVRDEVQRFNRKDNCDSIATTRYKYVKSYISLSSEDVSCYNYSDGKIFLDSINNLKSPLKYYLNGKEINDPLLLQNLKKDNYQLYVVDLNNCISDSISININQPDSLYVDIGKDTTLSKAQSFKLSSSSNGINLKYQWTPNQLFNCPTCKETTVQIDSTITVELWVEDENGCIAKDILLIRLIKNANVWAPNSFSPNGDGINDHFTLYGDPSSIIQSLQIYNRWGELVFHSSNIPLNDESKGWNGHFKSQLLNSAVFVFSAIVAHPDVKEIKISGDITLVR